jgi:hypothetical protein
MAAGLFPLLASFDVIPSDDDDFGAPRWFVAAVGHLFTLVGTWLALTRAPEWPLLGLLRALQAPLLHALCAAFCAAIVIWPRRVGAGSTTRSMFLALAVIFALATAHALVQAAGGLRRRRSG